MVWSSPRDNAGLRILAASRVPSAPPAPMMVWNSSINKIQRVSLISSTTFLRRSSNCPRYLVPATKAPMSSDTTRLPRKLSGTSPATMRWASPSTMAVLPTPGSPIKAGLFWLRRTKLNDPVDFRLGQSRVEPATFCHFGQISTEGIEVRVCLCWPASYATTHCYCTATTTTRLAHWAPLVAGSCTACTPVAPYGAPWAVPASHSF